ncbi:MAG: hypothetical protein QM744_08605 [Mesorhizobium sp.]
MTISTLGADDRAAFARIADVLLPAHKRLPAASSVDVSGKLLDAVIAARPDIAEAVKRALAAVHGMEGRAAAEHLLKSDGEGFDAVGLAASGAYFMSPAVREKLGYPGQEAVRYDPYETPEYQSNGMLERVLSRGPIFRDARRPR